MVEKMTFQLSSEQKDKVNCWLKETVYPAVIKKQKEEFREQYNLSVPSFVSSCWEVGLPYEGAIGGGLTYQFTPTSLGVVSTVKYGNDYEFDVTEYDSW